MTLRAFRRRINLSPLGEMIVFALLVVGFVFFCGAIFYVRGQTLMEEQLRTQLRNTAAAAVGQFDPADVEAVHGRSSLRSPELKKLVTQLRGLRSSVPTIRYAYILRRSRYPTKLEFVADADTLATNSQLDVNHDGVIQADELPSFPGDLYDGKQSPTMLGEAFDHPAVDSDITYDQWGALISGYAPIKDAQGKTIAILGIDMRANEFIALSQSMFTPVLFLLIVGAGSLLAFYVLFFLWRRRVAGLREMEQDRASLLYLTSQRLGTPLTIFHWTLESLQDPPAGEAPAQTLKRHVGDLEKGVEYLEKIWRELNDAMAMENGKVAYTKEYACVYELIEQAAKELSSELAHSKHKISLRLDRSLCMMLDKKIIGAVIRELLENAIAFSPAGSDIDVFCRRSHGFAEIEVRDHGAGIPRKDQPRLFEKFARASNADRYKPDSSGLGLFIARRAIERAGGDIWIESKEGKGTSVFFTLPVQ